MQVLLRAASKRSPCGHRVSPTAKVLLCLHTGPWQHLRLPCPREVKWCSGLLDLKRGWLPPRVTRQKITTTKWFFAILMHPLTYHGTCSESCVQAHTQGVYPISWNKRAEGINLGLKKKDTIHFQWFLDWLHQLPLRRALQHFSVTVRALTQNLKF